MFSQSISFLQTFRNSKDRKFVHEVCGLNANRASNITFVENG